jgi:hypothetical protein
MTETITLERRETFKYRDGWAYEDEWQTIGHAKVVRSVKLSEDRESAEEYTSVLKILRVQPDRADIPDDHIKDALRDTFGGSNCQHDYDCCGCWHSHARVRKMGKYYAVRINSSRNY